MLEGDDRLMERLWVERLRASMSVWLCVRVRDHGVQMRGMRCATACILELVVGVME